MVVEHDDGARRPRGRPRERPRADGPGSRRASPTDSRRVRISAVAACRAASRRIARPDTRRTAAAEDCAASRGRAIAGARARPAHAASAGPVRWRPASAPASAAPDARRRAASSSRAHPRQRRARRRPRQHAVGDVERARARRAVPDEHRQQFVVAERCGAAALQLLARPIVRRQVVHATRRLLASRTSGDLAALYSRFDVSSSRAAWLALVAARRRAVPNLPTKERHQAESAPRQRHARPTPTIVRARRIAGRRSRARRSTTTPSRSATTARRSTPPSTRATARTRPPSRPATQKTAARSAGRPADRRARGAHRRPPTPAWRARRASADRGRPPTGSAPRATPRRTALQEARTLDGAAGLSRRDPAPDAGRRGLRREALGARRRTPRALSRVVSQFAAIDVAASLDRQRLLALRATARRPPMSSAHPVSSRSVVASTRRAECRPARPRPRAGWRRRTRPPRPPPRTRPCPTLRSGRRRVPRSECAPDRAPRPCASSTFVPSGKNGCTASAAADRVQARLGDRRPSTTHCGLPTRRTTAVTRSPATSSVSWRKSLRLRPSPRETSIAPRRALEQRQRLRPGAGRRSRARRRAERVALERQPRRHTSHAVARHFRAAAVRVEELRHGARAASAATTHQAVGADAAMPIAQARGRARPRPRRRATSPAGTSRKSLP